MRDKWLILALLFSGRCLMGLQFESVGALGPLLKAEGVDYGQIGVLIGAYLAPGLLVSLPGGMVVQRLGDRTTMLLCLMLMAAGGALELGSDWTVHLLARVLAGTGGVVLTVAATKMIVDRFSGRELATAMAVFVNAWPCGIALSLICLPPVAQSLGLTATSALLVALAAFVLLLTAVLMPETGRPGTSVSVSVPSRTAVLAVCVAGAIWGIANAAFATVFGFGPALLAEKGYLASAAASQVSIVLWVTILAIPVGGVLASRYIGATVLIVICLLAAAASMSAVPRLVSNIALFVGIGIISGLPGAAVMSLPSRVLDAPVRAVGMGIFYSVTYGVMLAFPMLQGALARDAHSAAITFDSAALALLATIPLLGTFAVLARSLRRDAIRPIAVRNADAAVARRRPSRGSL